MSDGTLYAGGNLVVISGEGYFRIAKLSPASGSFTEVGLQPRRGYAQFSSPKPG